ncbi:hypothetical protein QP564_014190 [Bacillus subtilis]|uniref:hypothetical protein n=1 Tax=Bacillus subtilis TaxID=1423 RepID=UPI00254F5A95|nr:hypothetical protein [Bacillus subtilis]MDK7658920.1 hypothetical protein [Bacillus subtilis]
MEVTLFSLEWRPEKLMERVYTRFGINIKENGLILTKAYDVYQPEELYYLLIGLELQDFKSYLDEMELSVEKIKNDMLEKDLDAFNFLLSDNYEYAHRIDMRYPHLLKNSVFLSLYSLLEDVLFRFFETCNYRLKKDVKIKENGNIPIIDKYFRGIEDVLKFKIPNNFKKEFSNYRKVRNCIAHKRGYVTWGGVTDGKILNVISNLFDKGVSLSENKKGIILDDKACYIFIAEIEKIFKLLCEVLIKEEFKIGMHMDEKS